MSKMEFFKILSNYDPNEKYYDQYASLRIDTAAKKSQVLTLEKAYESLRNEPQFQGKTKQAERLKAVRDIFSASIFENEPDKIKRHKSLFGIIDVDNQHVLDSYSFKVHDNRNVKFINISAHISEMVQTAQELAKYEKKCIVLIRNYGFDYLSGELYTKITGEFGRIFYFENDQLIQQIYIGSRDLLHGYLDNKDAYDLNTKETLRLKRLTLKRMDEQNLLCIPDQMMSLFAAKPNNSEILRYLIKLGLSKKFDIDPLIKNSLGKAIRFACLSNVQGILTEYKDIAHDFFFHDSIIDLSLLLDEKGVKTDSPLIDILVFFYQCGNKILSENLFPYFKIIDQDREDKISTKLYNKRYVIALFVISMKRVVSWNQFTDLVNVLNNENLTFEFYKNNQLFDRYQSNSSDTSLLRHLSLSEKLFYDEKMINFSTHLETAVMQIFKFYLPFPTELMLLVRDYMLPSFFVRIVQYIRKLNVCATTYIESPGTFPICSIPVTAQDAQSADCGYWALFNFFKLLSQLSTMPSSSAVYQYPFIPKNPLYGMENENKDFKHFKSIVKEYLNKKEVDLTALDVEKLFKLISTKNKIEFNLLFPNVCENLLNLESFNIPAYTVINFLTLSEDAKLDPSYVFGGCFLHLKIQIAINFYKLSQFKNQPFVHFILIRANQHWHLQLLTFSYFSPGSMKSFLFDSGATPKEILIGITIQLQDLLDNPENYAENIAKEVIPIIHAELQKLRGLEDQVHLLQDYCQLLIKFFSTFGCLPFSKQFFYTLELAKKIACLLQKDYPQFVDLSHELLRLCQLSVNQSSSTSLFAYTNSNSGEKLKQEYLQNNM